MNFRSHRIEAEIIEDIFESAYQQRIHRDESEVYFATYLGMLRIINHIGLGTAFELYAKEQENNK